MRKAIPKPKALLPGQKLQIFADELKRKDRIIDELRKENRLLLKISLKKAEKKAAEKDFGG